MKPAPFEYLRGESVGHVLDALAADEDARLLAGGQSLLPLMALRMTRPSTLVDVGDLAELDRVFGDESSVLVGGMVRHRRLELDPELGRRLPLVAAAAANIGHVGIRNRGTLAGSLAHADPAGELPLAMLTLGATVYAESAARGRREVAAEDLFVSYYANALEPDEMITWVRVPERVAGWGWGFAEVARRHGDFALAGAACVVRLDPDGAIADLRAGLMAVADRPLLLSGERAIGEDPADDVLADLVEDWLSGDLADEVEPYRLRVSRTVLRRALADGLRRAAEESS